MKQNVEIIGLVRSDAVIWIVLNDDAIWIV